MIRYAEYKNSVSFHYENFFLLNCSVLTRVHQSEAILHHSLFFLVGEREVENCKMLHNELISCVKYQIESNVKPSKKSVKPLFFLFFLLNFFYNNTKHKILSHVTIIYNLIISSSIDWVIIFTSKSFNLIDCA